MSTNITINQSSDFAKLNERARGACKSLRLGKDVHNIDYILNNKWGKLGALEVDKDNPHFTMYKGCICSKDLHTVLWLPRKKYRVALELSDLTRTIAANALSGSHFLMMLDTGDTCVSIQDWAMSDSNALREVNLGKRVAVLSPSAFANTPKLERVNIHPENEVFTTTKNAIFANNGELLVAVFGKPNIEDIVLTENCTGICNYTTGADVQLVIREGRVIRG